ncbi:hypothetical protein GMDG_03263 [Pseudogymnoascus destructans 20631-21]|uniref:Uncharacterized protein n=1 Tax=Pseudogymnoascus destructans (strain ATCC MYA-4855 / 20631-21) TaxID=658429 RepID=L8G7E7_PSED2|nr:hypothetical protein GMDG_03263 [Pseudogymnoascus destructans 20631-21]
MAGYSIDRFVQDQDTPRAIGQPRLSLAASRQDTSDAIITQPVPTAVHAHVRESCKSPPTSPSSVTGSTVLSRSNTGFSTFSKSSAASEATSLSTAPSIDLNHPELIHDQHILNMSIDGSNLPCLFRYIIPDCQHMNFDDSESWSEHVIEHFGPSRPPPHALCVFCNTSFEDDNAMACWNKYLEHVKEHFESGTTLELRPDFGVLKYLRDKAIITEDDYAVFCRDGSERPKVFGLIPLDCEPEEIVAKKQAEEAASNRIIVSDPRRRRDQQRSPRGKKASSTVIHSRTETF